MGLLVPLHYLAFHSNVECLKQTRHDNKYISSLIKHLADEFIRETIIVLLRFKNMKIYLILYNINYYLLLSWVYIILIIRYYIETNTYLVKESAVSF